MVVIVSFDSVSVLVFFCISTLFYLALTFCWFISVILIFVPTYLPTTYLFSSYIFLLSVLLFCKLSSSVFLPSKEVRSRFKSQN
jgi:TRAP-type mannitol/chloroaromatic compound transport system permease large subunit